MNVISWENGDRKISDYPACSARPLARLVQTVNDGICSHTKDGLLCPPCSLIVLELGHQTVGTGNYAHKQLCAWLTELIESPKWGSNRFNAAGSAAAAIAAADAAAYAAAAIAAADATAYSACAAADAAAGAAACTAADAATRVEHCRQAIAAWHRICGTTPPPVEAAKVQAAYDAMVG
jgi:hypothetical protein